MGPIHQDGWVLLAPEAAASEVLCLPSVNLELAIQGDLCAPPEEVRPGQKNLVAEISDTYQPETDRQFFRVTLFSGRVLEFEAEPGHWGPAGSSFNVAMALRRWGVARPALCAPVGNGSGGTSIRLTFERDGLSAALFESHEGTPRTLTVRDGQGRSTLFCRKVNYSAPPGVVGWVDTAHHRLVVATGVKPVDVPLVSRVYFRQQPAMRAFTPHKELISDLALRPDLVGLLSRSNILQVNADEASMILEEEVTTKTAEASALKLREMMGRKAYAIITLGGQGAVLATDEGCLFQPIFPVQLQDESGGGDSHLAAFLYCRVMRGYSLSLSLRAAAWVASRVVSKVGPWVGLPTAVELDQQISLLAR